MMFTCGYNGQTIVQEVTPKPPRAPRVRWLLAEDRTHVVDDLKDNAFVRAKYAIGEWCDEAQAFHATLTEETP